MKIILMLFLVFIACFTGVYAQQIQDTTIRIDDVVVSATRTATNRSNVPLTISVINRKEIEQSGESAILPLLSQRVPGLFVTQRGVTGFGVSDGSAGTVNIRGVGQGNKVLMLLDGQPQWAGLFGHHVPDIYVASDIERVEVIRGPASLIYGSNAMGGAINITTRNQQSDGMASQASIMYGSFNTQKYMINNGYKKGKLSTFISFNHDRTNGHRPNSDFQITNGFAKINYQFTPRFKGTLDLSLAKIKSQNPGMISKPIYDNDIDVLRGAVTAGVENKFAKSSGALRFFYNFGRHKVNDGYYGGEQPQNYIFNSQDHNYGILAYQSFNLFKGNSFTIGLDYKNWGGHAWQSLLTGGAVELANKSIDEVAAYFIMQQRVMKRVSLTAGVRYEYNSAFYGAVIPHGGITYSPWTNTHFKASVSKGFRSPNIRELYMFKPANPNLKPENMLTYEVSVGQRLLGGKLFAELTAFLINGKDMIQTVPIGGRPQNINTGRFTNRGVEFELNYSVNANLNLYGNWSYLHLDRPIVAAPERQLFIGGSYSLKQFTFSLNGQSVEGLYTSIGTSAEVEDYLLFNGQISYLIAGNKSQKLTIFAKVDNITNQKYSINYGFPMPGTIFMGGLTFRF